MIAKSYICFWFQWYNDHRVQHLLDLILLPPFNFSFFFSNYILNINIKQFTRFFYIVIGLKADNLKTWQKREKKPIAKKKENFLPDS